MKNNKRKNFWRLWCYALGAKSGKDDKEANVVSAIRTFIFLTYFITNCFIIANAIHNLSTPKCHPKNEQVSNYRKT